MVFTGPSNVTISYCHFSLAIFISIFHQRFLMGKTTQTTNSSVQAKEKGHAGTSKSASSNSNVQRRRKSRSGSTKRRSLTQDLPSIVRGSIYSDQSQINLQSDMSDGEDDHHTTSQKDSQQALEMMKYVTRISKYEFKCNECAKV